MNFKIELTPYPRTLIVVHDTLDNAYQYFIKKNITLPNCLGCADSRGSIYYIFINKDTGDQATLAHELIHISWFLNTDFGVEYSPTCDEHQTHFVSYLMRQINKKIKIPINRK